MQSIQERSASHITGFPVVLVLLAAVGAIIYLLTLAEATSGMSIIPAAAAGVSVFLALPGFIVVAPNDARVLVFLGKYSGTIRKSGFFWANPFAQKIRVSLRVRNFNSDKLKVNDSRGNPIEIAAVVVWRVTDSARALFDVEHYAGFVAIQSETAIRAVASRFPYDPHEDETSLRGDPDALSEALKTEIQARLDVAGVTVVEARLSHLAYATEIAQAMLRRQQAQAIVSARIEIVEGAVGMVKMALAQLEEFGIVELDADRKAAMVNNLLVALVADTEAQPVINTGSVY